MKRTSFGKALSFLDSCSKKESVTPVKTESVEEERVEIEAGTENIRLLNDENETEDCTGDIDGNTTADIKIENSSVEPVESKVEDGGKSTATLGRVQKSLWSASQPTIACDSPASADDEVDVFSSESSEKQSSDAVRSKYFSSSSSVSSQKRSKSTDVLPGKARIANTTHYNIFSLKKPRITQIFQNFRSEARRSRWLQIKRTIAKIKSETRVAFKRPEVDQIVFYFTQVTDAFHSI